MDKKATFVIAVYNETETLIETLYNLFSTIKSESVDVIVVDDEGTLNDPRLKLFPNTTVFHNPKRQGVGYALDFGVSKAQTEIVFIMGCDIRFKGDWFDRFYYVTASHPKSIISTVMAGLNDERRFIQGGENLYYAAHVLFHVTKDNNNRVLPFREYIEAKWNRKADLEKRWGKKFAEGDVEEVGCALGAFYGINKSFFESVGGFKLHRTWGSLEPLISLRYAINGGNSLIDLKTMTGHMFKKAGTSKPVGDLIYNKLLIAYTLLPAKKEKEVFDWIVSLKSGSLALNRFNGIKPQMEKFRQLKDSLTEEELIKIITSTGVMDE